MSCPRSSNPVIGSGLTICYTDFVQACVSRPELSVSLYVHATWCSWRNKTRAKRGAVVCTPPAVRTPVLCDTSTLLPFGNSMPMPVLREYHMHCAGVSNRYSTGRSTLLEKADYFLCLDFLHVKRIFCDVSVGENSERPQETLTSTRMLSNFDLPRERPYLHRKMDSVSPSV